MRLFNYKVKRLAVGVRTLQLAASLAVRRTVKADLEESVQETLYPAKDNDWPVTDVKETVKAWQSRRADYE